MEERRKQEVQIEELRKTLREKERSRQLVNGTQDKKRSVEDEFKDLECLNGYFNGAERPAKKQRKSPNVQKAQKRKEKKVDADELGHTTCWGSFYSRDDKRWGYACCKLMGRQNLCNSKKAMQRETLCASAATEAG
eukprot:Trichotokara_eunicae@DN3556_c0_g1_i1.p1